jgi:succinate dehydrogenase / fumarate reductase, membrane anchor subunit
MNRRTSLARALGLGSSQHGTSHWWQQRLTAIALLPLGLWLGMAIARLPSASYEDVRGWIASPVNSVLLLTFTAIVFHHAALGLQVIIEDYVHTLWLRLTVISLVNGVLLLAALAAGLAILRITLGS